MDSQSKPQLPTEVLEALRHILDYLMDDEAADYLANSLAEGRENHIYNSLSLVDRWLARLEGNTG